MPFLMADLKSCLDYFSAPWGVVNKLIQKEILSSSVSSIFLKEACSQAKKYKGLQ